MTWCIDRQTKQTRETMNIFALHPDTEIAAKWHCDKHVINQPKEYLQLLCTSARASGYEGFMPYKSFGPNLQLNKWLRAHPENWEWLWGLFEETSELYTECINGSRTHQSMQKAMGEHPDFLHDGGMDVDAILDHLEDYDPTYGYEVLHHIPIGMSDKWKDYVDPYESYRCYYIYEKEWDLNWKNRKVPDWYTRGLEEKERAFQFAND